MPSALAVAVLAGGQSRRMGRDKALLPLGNTSLLQHVIDAATPLSAEHLLISNSPQPHAHFGWPVKTDEQADLGPLGGLYTALYHTRAPHLLLLACDLPYLNTAFLRFLSEQAGPHQAVVPTNDDGLQPLCALYNRRILPTIEKSISENKLGMRRLLKGLDIQTIPPAIWSPYDPDNNLFTNLNTPADYQQLI